MTGDTRTSITRTHLGEVLMIVIVFAFSVHLVDPRGDMPLNDDWNFALATWTFAETGEFHFARLTGMSLRAQVIWGAAWTKLFGVSFEVLRASTLALSFATLILLLRLLTRFGVERELRVLATLALWFHPIFFWSSFTFMTHVPFLFVAMLAFYGYARGVTEGKPWLVGLGSLAVCVAFFIRQTGVAIAVAAVLVIWFAKRDHYRRGALIAAAPIGLFPLFWFGTDWLAGYPGQLAKHGGHLGNGGMSFVTGLVTTTLSHGSLTLLFASIFFLPLVIFAFPRRAELRRNLPGLVIVAIPIAWFVSAMIAAGQAIPGRFREDIFGNLRLGPQTLRDHWVFGYDYPLHLPDTVRTLVTIGAGLLAIVVVFQLIEAWRRSPDGPRAFASQLAVGIAVSSTLILAASVIFFDRYTLDALWPVAIAFVVGVQPDKRRMQLGIAALLVLAFFSIAATAEYFAWNRARWEGFSWLRAQGVTLEQMDGGYEINQYLLGGRHGEPRLALPGMSVVDDRYILSLTDVRGYRTLATFSWRAPLSFGSRELYVQERVGKGFIPGFGLE